MLVRFLKSHTPYLAGETASFPDIQAAGFISRGVAVAVATAAPDGDQGGPLIPSEQVAEGLDSLLAGFRQRGIDVDHATSIGVLVSQAASIVAAERSTHEAAKSKADDATGVVAGEEDPVSDGTPADNRPQADRQPETPTETTDGQRRTVTPPRVAKGAK